MFSVVLGSPNAHSPVLNLSKSNPDRILNVQERVSPPMDDQDGSVSDQEPLEDQPHPNQRATPQSHSDEDMQDNISEPDDEDDIKEQGKILFISNLLSNIN